MPQPHGLNVGDQVAIGGSRYSAYECASENQPPYTTGACDVTRVGFFNIRTNTNFANGHVLYFKGGNLPTPLVENTPYYVVNFAPGGPYPANADKFQIAASPTGSPIVIPQFNPSGTQLVVEDRPLPQAIQDTMYVVSVPSPSTMELSATPGGPPTVWTQIPFSYNGGSRSAGFSFVKIAPVYNLTFDGIEVLTTPAERPLTYYPFQISNEAGNAAGENYNIQIFRSWIHGPDDQRDFPMCLLNIGGHDIEVGWSIFEGAYSTANDTQNIGFMSTRNVNIHNNELKGATEGMMSGGNFPWFAYQTNTTNITVTGNYIWKPINAYSGILAVYVSPSSFELLPRNSLAGGSDCSQTANNPNLEVQCFAYQGEGERCDPTSPPVSRFQWTQSAANSLFTVTGSSAGQEGDLYILNNALHMDYNYSGSVTCPAGVTCTFVPSPAFPPGSTRLGIAYIGDGIEYISGVPTGYGPNYFDSSTFYQENRNPWSKNLLESKYGDYWNIQGNVFSGQDNCDNGSTCQGPALQLTVGVNGSGNGDPVNYTASTSYSTISNNIFEHLSEGISGVGKSFAVNIGAAGLVYEWAGFGQSINNVVSNNLFIDIGSTGYGIPGSVVSTQDTQNWTIEHNTAVNAQIGFTANADQGINYNSNILVPYQSAAACGTCPATPGNACNCTSPAATSDPGAQVNLGYGSLPSVSGPGANGWCSMVSNGTVDAASSFNNNIVMNPSGFVYGTTPGVCGTPGVSYTTSTYMIAASTSGYSPSSLFVNGVNADATLPPNYCIDQTANYRLAPGIAALYSSADGSPIGANIDAIEALTGSEGDGVAQGTSSPIFSAAPTITRQPSPLNLSVAAGQPATFSIAAIGVPNPLFQWREMPPGGSFTAIPGATDPSYTIPQVSISSSGYQFECDVTNGVPADAVSHAVTLTVTGGMPSPVTLTPPTLIKIYPNPWRSDKHAAHPSITFDGLTVGTTIKIFTVSAHEVKELQTDGPKIVWDLTNNSGDKVASGVYLYLITDSQGDKVQGKVAVIK